MDIRSKHLSSEDRGVILAEHENIIAAIATSDIEKADSLALEHANQIVTQIKQLIASDRRQKIAL
jgi:DNA-binding GntR family transcriptional regulator